eukprot:scaffold2912_cov129-Isochrysis_galbana.AAC.2
MTALGVAAYRTAHPAGHFADSNPRTSRNSTGRFWGPRVDRGPARVRLGEWPHGGCAHAGEHSTAVEQARHGEQESRPHCDGAPLSPPAARAMLSSTPLAARANLLYYCSAL